MAEKQTNNPFGFSPTAESLMPSTAHSQPPQEPKTEATKKWPSPKISSTPSHPLVDWDEWAREAVDQSSNLPDIGSVCLQKLTLPTNAQYDFGSWYHDAFTRLQFFDLHNLIVEDILRPRKNDENGIKWATWSRQVRVWLASSLSAEELDSVWYIAEDEIFFADEFVKHVQKAFAPNYWT
ncbi:hypothetical protein N7456_011143 [Penicillium angulare]|uniref:Uncharacterized protein n=1 Tax=Penicillium angulare TaxID=116970 RepID=A0A9W9K0F5_9EURO|nr:hypothetical protein N7456_011143 [Penicillium angulare]